MNDVRKKIRGLDVCPNLQQSAKLVNVIRCPDWDTTGRQIRLGERMTYANAVVWHWLPHLNTGNLVNDDGSWNALLR